MKISTASRNAMVNAVRDLIDGGSGAASIFWRTGAPPTNVADADSGTLLATSVMSDPSLGAASSGVGTANAIGSVTAVAAGTVGHFRVKDSAGVTVLQGTAGEAAEDAVFNESTWNLGDTIAVTSLTLTQPVGT